MPERRATDHIMNVDIAGPNGVTGRNSRTRPLDSVRGCGKVDVGDNVEIRHAVIVAMPLLHRLLYARASLCRAAIKAALGRRSGVSR